VRPDAELKRRAIAHHESGHAVVAFTLGVRFHRISVVGDEESGPFIEWSTQLVEPFDPAAVEERVATLFGGTAAVQLCVSPNWAFLGTALDMAQADDLAWRYYRTAELVAACRRRGADRAREIIRAHRCAVEALASGLLEHRELDGDQARAIIEAARAEQAA